MKSQSSKEKLKKRKVKNFKCGCRLRFCTPNTEGIGSIPGQGTKIPLSTGHDKNKQTKNTATNSSMLSLGEVRSLFSPLESGQDGDCFDL